MSALALQQQALLATLWGGDAGALEPWLTPQASQARGLSAYRANAQTLAERALAAAYPVTAQLLGGDSFTALAQALWHAHPPQRGDVAQWGEVLADFIATSAQLADEPYLADVARVEWALHAAAGAADADPDPASLARMITHDPDALQLVLAPGVALVPSPYPVASIVAAHAQGTPSLQEAGDKLRAGVAETALVWRRGFKPCARTVDAAEAALLDVLRAAGSLSQALDAAGDRFDFNAWLPAAVSSGLLLGTRTPKEPSP